MVYVESPFSGDQYENVRYAQACVADCIKRGENPYASHLFFPQTGILDDAVKEERELGMRLGFAWAALCGASVFYIDRGWSNGMLAGWKAATAAGRTVEVRSIQGKPLTVPL